MLLTGYEPACLMLLHFRLQPQHDCRIRVLIHRLNESLAATFTPRLRVFLLCLRAPSQ
jgi:hypothetical protein